MIKTKETRKLSPYEIDEMNEKRWSQCRKLAKSMARQSGIKIHNKKSHDDYHDIEY